MSVKEKISDADRDFLMNTSFFTAIPDAARVQLMEAMERVHIPAKERFFSQGEEADGFYIIQDGLCIVSLEKNKVIRPLALFGAGDLIGETAILTGEPRGAHADAQTDLDMWKLSRAEFERIYDQYPEVRRFLTQIVTDRFERAPLTADRTVGKYVINDILGRGGWSVVYRGVHTMLNMPVAVKMLKHTMAADSEFFKKFQDEARIIAKLNHENIVKVYDIELLYRTVFIIMELLVGRTLASLMHELKRPPLPRAVNILLQVCRGLGFAHKNGVIHGDVKPGNIFIQEGDRVKIVDFGLAYTPGTRSKLLVGTPLYFSPEQILKGTRDERSDIYSLGISFFRVFTGEEAFQEFEIPNLLQRHLNEDIPNPRLFVPDLPDELCAFLLKATKKDPTERYQSTLEIINDLFPLAKRLGAVLDSDAENHTNMMGLFLFYRDEQEDILKRLVKEFGEELTKVGAVLRETDLKKI